MSLKGCASFKFNESVEPEIIAANIKKEAVKILKCEKGKMWKTPRRGEFIKFGWDNDDFARGLITCILTAEIFRVPRIFNTVKLRKNKRFINKFRKL